MSRNHFSRSWCSRAMDPSAPQISMRSVHGITVAGATFQGLLRNPLADPYVLGTASGAALGAAIALVVPVQFVPNLVAALQEHMRVFSESYSNVGWSNKGPVH